MLLFNPKKPDFLSTLDESSQKIMLDTINFFEQKGKARIKKDDRDRVWYADFLEYNTKNKLFSQLLTPESQASTPSQRWDTYRNCFFNEILGFYGLPYWYTWQVTILGLGPIWMSKNNAIKNRTAQLLSEGSVFGFGLSEKAHGADIYSTEMSLTPTPEGGYLANGRKYYIGNGNKADYVSTFGRIGKSDEYVFFVADYKKPQYECVQNVVNSQSYVAEYALTNYPITDHDILSRGPAAWDMALNTVNVGKFNLGWCSIGICTHAFYEAINHAAHRILYGRPVTAFNHVQHMLSESYLRLAAMRLFASRANDYMRASSLEDRRYLLYNSIVKMKVTSEGEKVVDLLWDVIAAKGFEKDTYFEMASRDIRALPKLEGTVHVNIALVNKFIKNYFFNHRNYPELNQQTAAKDDSFLFDQGSAGGLSKIQFHNYEPEFRELTGENISIFIEQINLFKKMIMTCAPDEAQIRDTDFYLAFGQIFTTIVYAQLVAESCKLSKVDSFIAEQLFSVFIDDFTRYALQLYQVKSTSPAQTEICMQMIKRPSFQSGSYETVFTRDVVPLIDTYKMND